MSVVLGKYALSVLLAWGAGLALLALLVVQTLRASARARRALAAEEARRDAAPSEGAGAAAEGMAPRHG